MAADNIKDTVKRRLRITWSDLETEAEITEIVSDAIATLTFKLGAEEEIDFSAAGPEKELLCNYCLYAYNNCLNEFEEAYAAEIRQLRIKYMVLSEESGNE